MLVLSRLAGAALQTAVLWSLACSTVLLSVAGWRIGRHGGLTRWERIAFSAVAALFGIGLIVLKTALH